MEKDGNKIRVQTERTIDGGIWFYASAIKKKNKKQRQRKEKGSCLAMVAIFSVWVLATRSHSVDIVVTATLE